MAWTDYFIYSLTSSSQKYIKNQKRLGKNLHFMRECNKSSHNKTHNIKFLCTDIMRFLFLKYFFLSLFLL